MRFLFGEPRFLRDADNAKLQPPAFSIDESGLHLTEQIRRRAAALRCARWIRDKVEIRSVKRSGLLHGKLIHIDDGRRHHAVLGSSNFTVNGLGLGDTPNIELNLIVDSDRDREDLHVWFNELWSDQKLTEDVREEVLRALEANYAHVSPEFVYFKTLLHLFDDFLVDRAEEDVLIQQTAFEQTAIWRALFDFQRDGLRAVLSKIDKHGGCILADSVGLGKTYTALAVIKWFEKRNKNVLVLCPKKLRENWTEFLATNNSEMNPLREDRFGYTVLSHTDLSREGGRVGDIDLIAGVAGAVSTLVKADTSALSPLTGRAKTSVKSSINISSPRELYFLPFVATMRWMLVSANERYLVGTSTPSRLIRALD